jgi:transcriptional regulator of arginine metabolism
MKAQRKTAILDLIRHRRVGSQEQLRTLLGERGFTVTQATLSRDVRELGLAKVSDPEGESYYAAPQGSDPPQPGVGQLAGALLLSAEGVGVLLVVRTPAGSANALASAIDRQEWPEVIGTLAGDDTILLITRGERARRTVARRLNDLTVPRA